MADASRASLIEAFHKATHLMSMKSRGRNDQWEFFLKKALIRTWPAADSRDYMPLFKARIHLYAYTGMQEFKFPQILRAHGTLAEGTESVARLLRGAALLLKLDQDAEVVAAIRMAEESTF